MSSNISKNEAVTAAQASANINGIDARSLIHSKDKKETGHKSDNQQISTLEKIFKTVLSQRELDIFRKFLIQHLIHEQSAQIDKNQDSGSSSDKYYTRSEIIKLLNSLSLLQTSDKETKLAKQIITDLLKSRNVESEQNTNKESSSQKLLNLLASLQNELKNSKLSESEIVNSIKNQANLIPEMRATLLQNLISESGADNLFIGNFLDKRADVVDAKRILIAKLANSQSAIIQQTDAVTSNLTEIERAKIIEDYLKTALTDISDTLLRLTSSDDNEFKLVLFNLNSQYAPANKLIPSEKYAYNQLLSTLALNNFLDQIQSVYNPAKDHEEHLALKLRNIIKNILLENTAQIKSSETTHSLSQTDVLSVQEDFGSQATGLFEKLKVISEAGYNSHKDFEKISAKLLTLSTGFREFINKLIELNHFAITQSEIKLNDVAELSQYAINIAIESKSFDILKAASIFLKESLAQKDLSSAFLNLLIPSLCLLAENDDLNPDQKIFIKDLISRIGSLKNINKHKEFFKTSLMRLAEILKNFENQQQPGDKVALEKKLLESLSQDYLSRLNNLADSTNQSNFIASEIQTRLGAVFLEMSAHKVFSSKIEDDQGQIQKNKQIKSETIECSIVLPNIGESGISFTIFENNISLNISNSNQAALNIAAPLLPQLEQRIEELSFKNPEIHLVCEPPKQVKPEWIFQLLGGGAKVVG